MAWAYKNYGAGCENGMGMVFEAGHRAGPSCEAIRFSAPAPRALRHLRHLALRTPISSAAGFAGSGGRFRGPASPPRGGRQ